MLARLVALLLLLLPVLVPLSSSARETLACGQLDVRPLMQSELRIAIADDEAAHHDAALGHCADVWFGSNHDQGTLRTQAEMFAPVATAIISGRHLLPEVGPPRT